MIDNRLDAALNTAISRVLATARSSAEHVVEMLGLSSMSASSNAQRQIFLSAQFDLRYKLNTYHQTFANTLQEKVYGEIGPLWGRSTDAGYGQPTDWESLSLVGDAEVEERISAERLGMEVAQECEAELRELAGYMSSLLGLKAVDFDRNPLRPQLIGRAMFRAIEGVSQHEDVRKVLAKELSRHLAQSMRTCYKNVIDDLRQRGTQPVGLAMRGVQGPGNDLPQDTLREASAYKSAPRDKAAAAQALRDIFGLDIPDSLYSTLSGAALNAEGARSTRSQGLGGFDPTHINEGGWSDPAQSYASTQLQGQGAGAAGPSSGRSFTVTQADAHLLDVIKRIAYLTSGAGALAPTTSRSGAFSSSAQGLDSDAAASHGSTPFNSTPFGTSHGAALSSHMSALDSLSGLVAINLIRAHREELRKASTGALDHMVIDVVGALFDQVLSDPKVPPQMARQIARLQLPVLRAAMKDVGFFNSRSHPVRRFVNRIATLSAVYEDYDSGPGQEMLKRVRALVQEIVEGDFDQFQLYEAKLSELENFIKEQNEQENTEHADVTKLLGEKEAALRIQQRYTLALQTELSALPLHDFVRDFLAQVWSQVQVSVATNEGPQSELAARMRRAARDLIFSVQPKGTPALRKEFLLTLPRLMKDLNEGLDRIRWPEAAKKSFFSKLLPAHAESLKQSPLSDFAQRQLQRQVDNVERVPIPGFEDVAQDTAPVALPQTTQPMAFSEEEIEQAGLVEETAIDWEIPVEPVPEAAGEDGAGELDINLDTAPPPSSGAALIQHIQAGVPYQMHINGAWKKVRLNWVSPGRAFFIFTHGRQYKETVSVTSRMLIKMCETQRFRAFEQAQLIERATARARKQLAALAQPH